jgi:hypothetical protein
LLRVGAPKVHRRGRDRQVLELGITGVLKTMDFIIFKPYDITPGERHRLSFSQEEATASTKGNPDLFGAFVAMRRIRGTRRYGDTSDRHTLGPGVFRKE